MISQAELSRLTSKYDIANVPGYLSYPAVGKWNRPITDAEVIAAIQAHESATSGKYLYFHFPYCETLCYYSNCYMRVTADPKTRYDEYVDALDRELALKLDRAAGGSRLPVAEMHWGGGTPTYMNCEQIERAFRCIERRVEWAPNAVLSLEAYPDSRTLSEEKIELVASLGFRHVSFGIESLDPKVLDAINRRHDAQSIGYWIDKAHRHGLGVHVDLVYGLPYQTPENFFDTIRTVLSFRPDRLATFSFMYTPQTVQHQRAIPHASVPNSEARFRLYEILQETTAALGYTRVGVDHWMLSEADPLRRAKGAIAYGFQGYEPLSRQSFLGFGSSAISFLQNRYFQNVNSINDYLRLLSADAMPVVRERSALLSEDDQIRHRVILKQVMSDLRIDKPAVEREFRIAFDRYFADALPRLRAMEDDGLVHGAGSKTIEITPLGRAFVRCIANAFDRYYPAWSPRIADVQSTLPIYNPAG